MTQPPSAEWPELSDEFHKMIGYCIAEWSRLEDELFQICRQCLKCPEEQAAIVYHRTPSVGGRLTLVDELVQFIMPKPARKSGGHPHDDLKLWNELVKKFRELSKTRSRIAHQPVTARVTHFSAGHPIGQPLVKSGFEIYVSYQEQLRGNSAEPPPPLGVNDLKTHHGDVTRLRGALQRFLAHVLPKHVSASPPQSAQP
jgi:hypothetical protein